jgi:hypothetical protein
MLLRKPPEIWGFFLPRISHIIIDKLSIINLTKRKIKNDKYKYNY